MAWTKRKIGELADISRGSSPRPITDTRFSEGGTIPWVKIADATRSGKFTRDTKEHVNEFGASFSRYLPEGTILVAASGVTLGFTTILGIKGCAHDGWLILQNLRGLDRDYAYYFLKTIGQQFHNSSSGAAIQNINTDILRRIEIPLPPLPLQRRISGILSAYDEMIENNTRRIAILEEMARLIYREWFVNFRFPGYEKVKFVDSAMGKIPAGWQVKKLGDVLELRYGKALKTEDRIDGKIPVYGSSGVIGFHNEALVEHGGIIVGRKGNVGSILWSDVPFFPIDTAFFIKSSLSTFLLFYDLSTRTFLNSDAAVPGLNRAYALSLPFLLPSTHLVSEFDNIMLPIFELKRNLNLQNSNLRQTRDLLLPRLISGEIDVSEMGTEISKE